MRHPVEFDLDPRARARGGFAGGTSQPRRAHVLHPGHRAGGEQFQAGAAHPFFHDRIARRHRATLAFRGGFRQILRRKHRAREPVPSRRRAQVKHRISHALRRAARDLFMPQHAKTKGVHERVARVGRVEINLSRHRREAKVITVMRKAADHPGKELPIVLHRRCVGRAFVFACDRTEA